MEIELGTWPDKRVLLGGLVALVLVGLALLGRGVTPVEGDGPTVLTPAAWAAANLSRQARAATERLQRDAGELCALLASPAPLDPVHLLRLSVRPLAALPAPLGGAGDSTPRSFGCRRGRLRALRGDARPGAHGGGGDP